MPLVCVKQPGPVPPPTATPGTSPACMPHSHHCIKQLLQVKESNAAFSSLSMARIGTTAQHSCILRLCYTGQGYRASTSAPKMAPSSCATQYRPPRGHDMWPVRQVANVTAGLRWPPDTLAVA